MPSITLDNDDIIKALNFLTGNKYNINTIIAKRITDNEEIEIVWTHKKR